MSAAVNAVVVEAGKLGAFMRRDWLILRSYRAAFVGDLLQLGANLLLFALIGRVVDSRQLPAFDGTHVRYVEFVAIGTALTLITGLLLNRVATAIRSEQMTGTLEALLATPTRVATIQAGTVAFDAALVPLRLGLFLAAVTLALGLDLHASGVLPAVVLLAAYFPFVWGLGLVSGAAILTFRRGAGIMGFVAAGMGLAAGAYFPLSVLPNWLAAIASWNPMARELDALREALLGSAGWNGVSGTMLELLPLSAASLAVGMFLFRVALARERRLGTLGQY